jgi:RNA polymerase sporulation-specific sigma factor
MIDYAIFEVLKDLLFFAGYISTKKSFPQPLSAGKEKEYLLKFKNGDESAKNVLVEKNMRLVAHIAKKYVGKNIEQDDLISIGSIGLIKGINSFDINKGTQLATYVSRCIDNEILMFIRSNKKVLREVSINDPIGTDKEGNEISLIDILGTDCNLVPDKAALNIEIEKLYDKISKTLTKREKTVVELRYGLFGIMPLTQIKIANRLNISRSYVSRIEKKALHKLCEAINRGDTND